MERKIGRTAFLLGLVAAVCHLASLSKAEAAKERDARSGDPRLHGTIPIQGKAERDYAGAAKISLQEAMKRANQAIPGKIVEAALEEEDGYLVYAIEVADSQQGRKEILIDAGTGKTLAIEDHGQGLKRKHTSDHDDDDDDDDNKEDRKEND